MVLVVVISPSSQATSCSWPQRADPPWPVWLYWCRRGGGGLEERRGRDRLCVLIGAAAESVFAWSAHGSYEANAAMIGTGFIGALLGAPAGAITVTLKRATSIQRPNTMTHRGTPSANGNWSESRRPQSLCQTLATRAHQHPRPAPRSSARTSRRALTTLMIHPPTQCRVERLHVAVAGRSGQQFGGQAVAGVDLMGVRAQQPGGEHTLH